MIKKFYVSRPAIKVKDIRIPDFDLGEIVRVELDLECDWNEPDGLYSEFEVRIKNATVSQAISQRNSMNGRGNQNLTLYWDTKDMRTGEYDLHIRTHYLSEIYEESFKASITPEEIIVFGITGHVAQDRLPRSRSLILMLAVAICTGFAVLFIRTKRKLGQF